MAYVARGQRGVDRGRARPPAGTDVDRAGRRFERASRGTGSSGRAPPARRRSTRAPGGTVHDLAAGPDVTRPRRRPAPLPASRSSTSPVCSSTPSTKAPSGSCSSSIAQPPLAEVAEPGVVGAALGVVEVRDDRGPQPGGPAEHVEPVEPARLLADLVDLVDRHRHAARGSGPPRRRTPPRPPRRRRQPGVQRSRHRRARPSCRRAYDGLPGPANTQRAASSWAIASAWPTGSASASARDRNRTASTDRPTESRK